MKYALFYNIFACWVVACMGFLNAYRILHLESRKPADTSFGFFWLFSGCLWSLSGIRLVFLYFGFYNLDTMTFHLVQVLVALHLVACVRFISLAATRNAPYSNAATLLSIIPNFLFVFFLIYDGIAKTTITAWTSEHLVGQRAFAFFLPVYVYCVLLTVYAMIQRILTALMRRRMNWFEFGAIGALMIYELAGIADVKGEVADYWLMFIRGLYMVSALIAFLSISWESSSMKITSANSMDKP